MNAIDAHANLLNLIENAHIGQYTKRAGSKTVPTGLIPGKASFIQHQNAHPGLGEIMGGCGPTRAGANYDNIVHGKAIQLTQASGRSG
jgi:hypothetical protein